MLVTTCRHCSPDTILRMATDKRLKQLERDCKLASNNEPQCTNKDDVENAWKEFSKLSDRYKEVNEERACDSSTRSPEFLFNCEQFQIRPESEHFDAPYPIRTRRQTCKTKSSLELNQLAHDFGTHCERDNICLPDEDLPAGPQRDGFKELHAARAKKYSNYLTQLFRCYGRL
ncbi:unnamed protein product [Haemonchus placei]|uniref:Uncharacterized protein n=1 Tax=Haemonchus placei TaxID=6290 RepID=A0A0N4WIM9_HAEPC|nr:unnamed protein product [Haemonchus placei]